MLGRFDRISEYVKLELSIRYPNRDILQRSEYTDLEFRSVFDISRIISM